MLLEQAGIGQGLSVGPKGSLCYGLSRFRSYLESPLFCSPGAHSCTSMAVVQSTPQVKHVLVGASWIGRVTLIQDHHGVPKVPVQKLNLEVFKVGRPTLAPLHQSCK